MPAWLRTEGVDLKTIGLFTLMQVPYTWKFLWSPLVDRYALPLLGRRRGWMLRHAAGAAGRRSPVLGLLAPTRDLWTIVGLATAIALLLGHARTS